MANFLGKEIDDAETRKSLAESMKNKKKKPSSLQDSVSGMPSTSGIGPVSDPDEYARSLGADSTVPVDSAPAVSESPNQNSMIPDNGVSLSSRIRGGASIPQSKYALEAEKQLKAIQNLTEPQGWESPEAKKAMLDQRQKAYDEYDKAKNNNDWAEVAQTLGQAIAQIGASAGGQQSGRNIGMLPFSKGIDYESRSARAAQDRNRRLQDIDEDIKNKFLSNKEARDVASENAKLGMEKASLYGRLAENDTTNQARLAAAQERADYMRANQGNKANPYEMLDVKNQYDQSKRNIEDLKKQEKAIQSFAEVKSAIEGGNLDKKTQQAYANRLSQLAGEAGISPQEEAAAMEAAQDTGVFGSGFFKGTDAAKLKQGLLGKLEQIKQLRAQEEQKMADIYRASGAAPQNTSRQQAPQSAKMVTVVHKKTGASKQFPAGSIELQNALQNPDFEVKK